MWRRFGKVEAWLSSRFRCLRHSSLSLLFWKKNQPYSVYPIPAHLRDKGCGQCLTGVFHKNESRWSSNDDLRYISYVKSLYLALSTNSTREISIVTLVRTRAMVRSAQRLTTTSGERTKLLNMKSWSAIASIPDLLDTWSKWRHRNGLTRVSMLLKSISRQSGSTGSPCGCQLEIEYGTTIFLTQPFSSLMAMEIETTLQAGMIFLSRWFSSRDSSLLTINLDRTNLHRNNGNNLRQY